MLAAIRVRNLDIFKSRTRLRSKRPPEVIYAAKKRIERGYILEVDMIRSEQVSEKYSTMKFRQFIRWLYSESVDTVICDSGSSEFSEKLSAEGFSTPDRQYIEYALSSRMVDIAVRKEISMAAIYARRPTQELDKVVSILASKVRTLAVILETEDERYIDGIVAAVGIPVISSKSAAISADFVLVMDDPGYPLLLKDGVQILAVSSHWSKMCSWKSAEYAVEDTPNGFDPMDYAAVLYQKRLVTMEMIHLIRLLSKE